MEWWNGFSVPQQEAFRVYLKDKPEVPVANRKVFWKDGGKEKAWSRCLDIIDEAHAAKSGKGI